MGNAVMNLWGKTCVWAATYEDDFDFLVITDSYILPYKNSRT